MPRNLLWQSQHCSMAAAALTLNGNAAVLTGKSLFVAALEEMPSAKDANGNMLTDGFLDLCNLVLPLIGEHVREAATAGSNRRHHASHGFHVWHVLLLGWYVGHSATPCMHISVPMCDPATTPCHTHATRLQHTADSFGTAFAIVKNDISHNIEVGSSPANSHCRRFYIGPTPSGPTAAVPRRLATRPRVCGSV